MRVFLIGANLAYAAFIVVWLKTEYDVFMREAGGLFPFTIAMLALILFVANARYMQLFPSDRPAFEPLRRFVSVFRQAWKTKS